MSLTIAAVLVLIVCLPIVRAWLVYRHIEERAESTELRDESEEEKEE